MAQRTYLPTAVRLIQRVCVYITENGMRMREHLNEEEKDALEALSLACTVFLALVELPVPPA